MKAALVGAGYWGPNLLRNLVSQPDLEGVIVCDRNPGRLEKARRRFPSVATTEHFEDLLKDPHIEAILLATPISTHGNLASLALEANKHVFIEKPMAASSREAERLVELSESRNRILMVGHTFEYAPAVLRAQEIVRSGDLGDLFFISMMRVNLGLHQRDASVIWDLVPHDLSILFFWLRETPSFIAAFGRDCIQRGVPDVAFVNLRFPGGVIANIEVAWLAPSKLRRTAVVGSKKMLVYDDTLNVEKLKVYDQGVRVGEPETFGEYQLSYRTGDIVSPQIENTEPLRVEVEHFLDCVRTGHPPRTGARSGLRVVRALEATERALRSGQPIHLEAERW